MQQEYLNLSQDEFVSKYGEQSYQQMQAMSASEKFQASLDKIKGVIGDIGTVFSPIIDGFAAVVGYLAESKVAAGALVGILTALAAIQVTMAIKSLITAYAEIFKGSFMAGPFGLPIAIAGAAALGGLIASAASSVQSVEDGFAPADRGPFTITDAYGSMATTATGDSLSVSPNLGRSDDRLLTAVNKLVTKDTNVYMDSQNVGSVMATATSKF